MTKQRIPWSVITSLARLTVHRDVGLSWMTTRWLWVWRARVGATIVYSGVMTFVLLKVIGVVLPLTADVEEESEGLDQMMHGEEAYVHHSGGSST